MKKWLIALLTLLALSLSVAFAAEANDITEDCKFKVCSSGRKYTLMTDKTDHERRRRLAQRRERCERPHAGR